MSSERKQKTIWDKALAAMKEGNTPVVAQMTKEVMASIRSYVGITSTMAEALNVLADYLSQNPAYRNDAADTYLFALKCVNIGEFGNLWKELASGLSRTVKLIDDKDKRASICEGCLEYLQKKSIVDIKKINSDIAKIVIDTAPCLKDEERAGAYNRAIFPVLEEDSYLQKAFLGMAEYADKSSNTGTRLVLRYNALAAILSSDCLTGKQSDFSEEIISVAEKFVSDIGRRNRNQMRDFLQLAQMIYMKYGGEYLGKSLTRKWMSFDFLFEAAKLVKPKSEEDKLLSERVEEKLSLFGQLLGEGALLGKVGYCLKLEEHVKEGLTADVAARVFSRGMRKLSAQDIFSLKDKVKSSENLDFKQKMAAALLTKAAELPTKTEQIAAYSFANEYAATPQEKQAAQQKCEEIQADWPRSSLILGADVFVKKAAALKRPTAQP